MTKNCALNFDSFNTLKQQFTASRENILKLKNITKYFLCCPCRVICYNTAIKPIALGKGERSSLQAQLIFLYTAYQLKPARFVPPDKPFCD